MKKAKAKTKAKAKAKTAGKTKLAARGKRIMSEAKAIRKANPNKKWQSCVAAAGKKLKGK